MYRQCGECPMDLKELTYPGQPRLSHCDCGYEICLACWNSLVGGYKTGTVARCPKCGHRYQKDRFIQMYPRLPEGELAFRVVSVKGIPTRHAKEDMLMKHAWFGQYGKVTKVSITRNRKGRIALDTPGVCSKIEVYFEKKQSALQCIKALNGFILDESTLGASYAIGFDGPLRTGNMFPTPFLDDANPIMNEGLGGQAEISGTF
ncbi:uncharacterized protein LOC121752158 [Salvia splendens]|uniref:uncharacterized protein LOC121752158 n=1 Tax=Salvia splendens TaxID=180675 RepID=UPI001C26D497|nr:uncharacterized protein LOC121752158 [Salvia splendens]